ncbi:hypothetical protein C8R43DRAFT_941244 [Mycena crocata]|nr:hypothetical protein C8R43DRAFT_941244 [Mycena crocata]
MSEINHTSIKTQQQAAASKKKPAAKRKRTSEDGEDSDRAPKRRTRSSGLTSEPGPASEADRPKPKPMYRGKKKTQGEVNARQDSSTSQVAGSDAGNAVMPETPSVTTSAAAGAAGLNSTSTSGGGSSSGADGDPFATEENVEPFASEDKGLTQEELADLADEMDLDPYAEEDEDE